MDTDPAKIGPGWWANDHITALGVRSPEDEDSFIRMHKWRIERFPCKKCRLNAIRFLASHNIREYKGMVGRDGRLIGMFVYTVEHHNYVNILTGEPTIELEDALQMWSGPQACSLGCDA